MPIGKPLSEKAHGTDMAAHLKEVITTLRDAFPDLHFEIHEIVGEHFVEARPFAFVDDVAVEREQLVDGERVGDVQHRGVPA